MFFIDAKELTALRAVAKKRKREEQDDAADELWELERRRRLEARRVLEEQNRNEDASTTQEVFPNRIEQLIRPDDESSGSENTVYIDNTSDSSVQEEEYVLKRRFPTKSTLVDIEHAYSHCLSNRDKPVLSNSFGFCADTSDSDPNDNLVF